VLSGKTFRMQANRYRMSTLLVILFLVVFLPDQPYAYIGPGAGFTFVSSFLIVFAALSLAFLTLLTWPVRWVMQKMRGRKALTKSRVEKVIIVGLDGQDPELTETFMQEGLLPHFTQLRAQGTYTRLQTTLPAESPVAWSSFQTGCNPGRHRVFDFLVPNRKSYLPELCSAKISPPSRTLSLGKYKIPLSKPRIQFERKSQSFWKILGDHGVFSTIIRVPISFPAERVNGLVLSAMPVPDLKGSQGTFSYYTSDKGEQSSVTGGVVIPVEVQDRRVKTYISGPENSLYTYGQEIRIPFEVQLGKNGTGAQLVLERKKYTLPLREYTPWISLTFRAGLGVKIKGQCRFYLKETTPHLKLYMSPINIDPGKPALPISYPFTYGVYLAKTQGNFATLGLAEDTWALNERVLDEEAFLQQAYLIHAEREQMLFDAIEKTNRGVVVCVFDITDRLQHMFWRYLEADHPANNGKDLEKHRYAIRELYQRMDSLVGRVTDTLDKDTVLIVMSDHGCKSFKHGINLNSWLYHNGYLALTGEPSGAEWFKDVNWSKTKAYAVGLGGIYLNLKGREAKGIVQPGEEEHTVKREIREGLRALYDEQRGTFAIREVYDTREVYKGPYVDEAPDLIVGARIGYRVSWTCATGAVIEDTFEDNTKSWSGDHCINPQDVPGIFFCNRKICRDNPSIMDVGPSVLDLFGVPVPSYCDGKSLMPDTVA
jgi:predicted AlkP superfamily phosphohydrolase/phosphomutase